MIVIQSLHAQTFLCHHVLHNYKITLIHEKEFHHVFVLGDDLRLFEQFIQNVHFDCEIVHSSVVGVTFLDRDVFFAVKIQWLDVAYNYNGGQVLPGFIKNLTFILSQFYNRKGTQL